MTNVKLPNPKLSSFLFRYDVVSPLSTYEFESSFGIFSHFLCLSINKSKPIKALSVDLSFPWENNGKRKKMKCIKLYFIFFTFQVSIKPIPNHPNHLSMY